MARRSKAIAPPKIVFVANEIGNFWHHRAHLVHAASSVGLRSVVFASPVGNIPTFEGEYRPITIKRYRLDVWGDVNLFLVVVWLLLRDRPRAINLINLKPYLFGGLASRLAKSLGWQGNVVFTVPGLGRLYQATNKPSHKLRRGLVEFFLRIAARGAHVTFETVADRDVWVARRIITPHQALVTRGSGVDIASFLPRQRSADGTMRVLFAGRLLRTKGLDVFLEAAARISDPKVEMIVAGGVESDPDAVDVERIRTHPKVRFLDQVDDMPSLLARTDLVVLPSRYNEGIPRILIEAAACGCVPIATRFPGSEMLIEHGVTGFMLDGTSPSAQIEQLVALISQLKQDGASRTGIGERAAAYVRASGFASTDIASIFVKLAFTTDTLSG